MTQHEQLRHHGPFGFTKPNKFSVIPGIAGAEVIDICSIGFEPGPERFIDSYCIPNIKLLDVANPENANVLFLIYIWRDNMPRKVIITNGEVFFVESSDLSYWILTTVDQQIIISAIKKATNELF